MLFLVIGALIPTDFMIKELLATLNEEQMEQAAQSSYAYWLATLSDKPPTAEERKKMALRECRRHIIKLTLEDAKPAILETLKYRKVRMAVMCF